MTIRQLSEYQHLSNRLAAAKAGSDELAVQRLKRMTEEAWNYLLLVEPVKKENTYSMIEFFLDRMCEDPQEELTNEQCRWKIRTLARSLADNPININHQAVRRV